MGFMLIVQVMESCVYNCICVNFNLCVQVNACVTHAWIGCLHVLLHVFMLVWSVLRACMCVCKCMCVCVRTCVCVCVCVLGDQGYAWQDISPVKPQNSTRKTLQHTHTHTHTCLERKQTYCIIAWCSQQDKTGKHTHKHTHSDTKTHKHTHTPLAISFASQRSW